MIDLWSFYLEIKTLKEADIAFLPYESNVCLYMLFVSNYYIIVWILCVFMHACVLCMCLCLSVCVCALCVCICMRAYVVRMTLVTSINILSVVDKHVRSYICPCRFDLITQCLWLNTFGQQLNVM